MSPSNFQSQCYLAELESARSQDVEAAEYDLMPHLLQSGALCRSTHLLVEWHLNSLPPPRRLTGLALRVAFDELLTTGCATSDYGSGPRLIVHEDYEMNNEYADVPGLAELQRHHNGTWPAGCARRPNCRSKMFKWRERIEHGSATPPPLPLPPDWDAELVSAISNASASERVRLTRTYHRSLRGKS